MSKVSEKSKSGRQPIPFTVVGPSGVGKATILSQLLKQVPGLALVKSLTSRSPRPDDGTLGKYVYVTPAEFESLVNQHQLLEWATVHGHYYGTLESAFEEAKRSGKDPILEIDVQGAMNLKALHPEAVLIFVAPPDQQALVDRLRSRSSESEEERLVRLKDAERELSQAKEFDHMVINDRLETAVEEIEAIIANERLKAETVS